jgi:hypothetical protein
MKKKGSSRIGLFGEIKHYDEKGRKIGESRPGIFGGFTEYDAKGRKIGESRPGLFGDLKHYDRNGKKTGESRWDLFGGLNHYDAKGRKTGHSDRGIFGDWKDYVPVLRPSLYSPNEHSWDDIILTMCQTELAHMLGAASCLIPMILGPILFKGFWAFFLTGLLAILAELCFVIVQRYNRPRVIAMLRKREREEAARARRNAY